MSVFSENLMHKIRSTSSRHNSATMISFHMIERAFESLWVALSIAHLTGVTSIFEKNYGTTHEAQGKVRGSSKSFKTDFGCFRSTSTRPSSATVISFHMIERVFESSWVALSIAHSTGVTSISEKILWHHTWGSGEGQGRLEKLQKWILTVLELENRSTSSRHSSAS